MYRLTDEAIYEIDSVLSHRVVSNQLQYYVKWLHSDDACTWETALSVETSCAPQIDLYWRQHPNLKRPEIIPPTPRPTSYRTSRPTLEEFLLRKSARLQEKLVPREGGIVGSTETSLALPRGGEDTVGPDDPADK